MPNALQLQSYLWKAFKYFWKRLLVPLDPISKTFQQGHREGNGTTLQPPSVGPRSAATHGTCNGRANSLAALLHMQHPGQTPPAGIMPQ